MSTLGNILKNLRGKRSLRDIAKDTGLSHSYIADLEKGYKHSTKAPTKPSPDTLKRLASTYNYPYLNLLKDAGYLDEKYNPVEEATDWEKSLTMEDIENMLRSYIIKERGERMSDGERERLIRMVKAALDRGD
jgi:transcriptional regulator with XRE-family HTH domain